MLCLLCNGPSQPLCEKLPLRISVGVGALANASPVASHMPEGGLDSRNLVEALRNLPVIPPDELETVSLFPAVRRVGVAGLAGATFSFVTSAMTGDHKTTVPD